MADPTIEILFPAVFLAVFVPFAAGLYHVLKRIGAWPVLARSYRYAGPFRGTILKWRPVRLNRKRMPVNLGIDRAGLCLEQPFVFGVGNGRLFIPWEDVEVAEGRPSVFGTVRIRFRKAPGVTLHVSRRLGLRIAGASIDAASAA
ncbi:MAG: hypothetical protein AB1346_03185 [Thermodesulfobacteriota bacterium]